MITLVLSAPLAALLENGSSQRPARRCKISVNAQSWPEVVARMRHDYPELAQRLFTASGDLASGFVVAVNAAVVAHGESIRVGEGDELAFVPQIAGG
jgi:molybdopterin converting factor small subunit